MQGCRFVGEIEAGYIKGGLNGVKRQESRVLDGNTLRNYGYIDDSRRVRKSRQCVPDCRETATKESVNGTL